jgi:hypothetical protein
MRDADVALTEMRQIDSHRVDNAECVAFGRDATIPGHFPEEFARVSWKVGSPIVYSVGAADGACEVAVGVTFVAMRAERFFHQMMTPVIDSVATTRPLTQIIMRPGQPAMRPLCKGYCRALSTYCKSA